MTDRKKELLRSVKFTLFSISAGVVEILSFTLLDLVTPWSYWPKYLIALVLSVIWNFTLNRRYTFKSAANVPIAMLKVFGYYCVFTPLSTLFGNFLAEKLLWNEYIVTALNMIINFVTEFIFDRFFVFGKSLDTNDLAKKDEQTVPDEANDANNN